MSTAAQRPVDICSFCGQVMEGGTYYRDLHGSARRSCNNPTCSKQGFEERRAAYGWERAMLMTQGLCIFDVAWIGFCGSKGHWQFSPKHRHVDPPVKAAAGDVVCEYHQQQKCACGKQAIAECDNTGQFVCGAPYCMDCGRHSGCHYG